MSGIELKGLRGLAALLENNNEKTSLSDNNFLSLNQLKPAGFQPRTVFDDATLQNLASSIRENGIIQPLIVRKAKQGYEIISGERRWRAAQLIGLDKAPVSIREVSNEVATVFSIVENVQRENLNPIDQAMALSKLVVEYSMTHEQISKIIGISRSAVTNYLRLLSLSDRIQRLVKEEKLETGHAKAISSLEEHEQIEVSNKIIEKNLSVRETEKLVQNIKYSLKKMESSNENDKIEINEWIKKLTARLDREVKISLNNNGKGYIEIKVNNKDEVKWLVEHLTMEKS